MTCLDRLGRSPAEFLETVERLKARGFQLAAPGRLPQSGSAWKQGLSPRPGLIRTPRLTGVEPARESGHDSHGLNPENNTCGVGRVVIIDQEGMASQIVSRAISQADLLIAPMLPTALDAVDCTEPNRTV